MRMEKQELILFLVTLSLAHTLGRRWRDGPSVDPGVFVITHIRSDYRDMYSKIYKNGGKIMYKK